MSCSPLPAIVAAALSAIPERNAILVKSFEGGGTAVELKTPCWVIRHWMEALRFSVTQRAKGGVLLCADLRNGSKFCCHFPDPAILWAWLKRPVFYGLRAEWLGIPTLIFERTPMPVA